jgi:hypothetical protein
MYACENHEFSRVGCGAIILLVLTVTAIMVWSYYNPPKHHYGNPKPSSVSTSRGN